MWREYDQMRSQPMFDRSPDARPEKPAASDGETSVGGEATSTLSVARSDLQRLCAAYDSLLTEGRGLSETAAGELTALAAVYDIDTDRPHEAVWRDLRGVLTRMTGTDEVSDALPDGVMSLTLLVVEDDPEAAQDLTETLVEAGHNVVGPFHDGDAAEAAAGLHSLDGALLDINLSGATTGVTLAKRLGERWGVPVAFLSGDITAAARHADLARVLVAKPYGRKEVLEAVARLSAG